VRKGEFLRYHHEEGAAYIDFESEAEGPLDPLEANGVTVSFRTTQQRYPSTVDVDWPVVVLPYSFVTSTPSGTNELMGVRTGTGLPDGQSRYEIRFSEPQRRAGVQRNWNTYSLTRFYNEAGKLLGEHRNTTNREYVGFLAGADDQGGWVARIELDGAVENGVTYPGRRH
jgi:hypothetical protein